MKSRIMIYRAVQEASTTVSPAATARSQTGKLYQFPYRAVSYPADVRIDDPIEEFEHPSLIVEIAASAVAFAFWLGWRVMHLMPASR